MTKDIIRMAREQGLPETANEGIFIVNTDDLGRLLAAEREALLAAIEKLRDESHTILGASDDYKQGREMGIQLCINELNRGEK